MSLEIPSDMAPFVDRMIAERRFLTESDVLAEGLRLLQSREMLGQEVRIGFQQLEEGLGVPTDQVYAHAEAKIKEVEQDNGAVN